MMSHARRHVGYVAHMAGMKYRNKILVTQPLESKLCARKRHSQKKNIKTHIQTAVIQN
jgi:hypothetical protein